MATKDIEILALKAETERLTLESFLLLGELETHTDRLRDLVVVMRQNQKAQPPRR